MIALFRSKCFNINICDYILTAVLKNITFNISYTYQKLENMSWRCNSSSHWIDRSSTDVNRYPFRSDRQRLFLSIISNNFLLDSSLTSFAHAVFVLLLNNKNVLDSYQNQLKRNTCIKRQCECLNITENGATLLKSWNWDALWSRGFSRGNVPLRNTLVTWTAVSETVISPFSWNNFFRNWLFFHLSFGSLKLTFIFSYIF